MVRVRHFMTYYPLFTPAGADRATYPRQLISDCARHTQLLQVFVAGYSIFSGADGGPAFQIPLHTVTVSGPDGKGESSLEVFLTQGPRLSPQLPRSSSGPRSSPIRGAALLPIRKNKTVRLLAQVRKAVVC